MRMANLSFLERPPPPIPQRILDGQTEPYSIFNRSSTHKTPLQLAEREAELKQLSDQITERLKTEKLQHEKDQQQQQQNSILQQLHEEADKLQHTLATKQQSLPIEINTQSDMIDFISTTTLPDEFSIVDTDGNTIMVYKNNVYSPASSVTTCKQRPSSADSVGTQLHELSIKTSGPIITSAFLNAYFVPGGKVPLSIMQNKPHWHKKIKHDLNLKTVNVCRTCKRPSSKHCCTESSYRNRTTATYVMGWQLP